MKLIINKPYIETNGETCRLISVIEKGIVKYPMYLQFDLKYKDYLVTEVADSYLVCLLLYAMQHKLDIECRAPITERLYVQLTEYLIPAISKNISKYSSIQINCALSNPKFHGKFAATGCSCGVDSFYNILKNLNYSEESGLNIKYLTFFNAGASGGRGGERARRIFKKRLQQAGQVAKELKCEFIAVDSNMNEFLKQNHEATHVFRTLSIPLALQKLFNIYYFSSGTSYSDFKFTAFDPAFYDILTIPNLSTDNLRFVLVGGETTRQGKIDYISKFDITKKYLNVCLFTADNCGICGKCKRTMCGLMLAGKLEEYSKRFKLHNVEKKKIQLIHWALRHRDKNDMPEICQLLEEKGFLK